MNHIRGKLTIAGFILSLLLMVTACGNNASEAPAAENPTEPETVMFQADNGEIEVPRNPGRVIVLADSYVGYLLQLGIKPIAVPQLAMDNPYFEGMLDGVEVIASDAVEKIMQLEPDLIITLATDENLNQLSKIAPTVAYEWGKKDYLELVTDIGKLVNKETEANKWLTAWNQKVEESKGKVQEAIGDQTVSIMETFSKGVYVFGANFARGGEVIYDALKLKAPEKVQKDVIEQSGFAEVSLEAIPDYAGDHIFFGRWAGETAENDKVEKSSVWQSLPAVKEGHVYPLDPRTSFFSDPISLEKTLDFIVKSLTEHQ
ncbi:iron-hydroxamate ABC transporter substrate-binding protein [Ammoniphilus sp. YIM 78166]|uniref:iron-hydroxamate ABC transporter substrate-binding protein n=1 Tax=Ammoniphilus sp. YIM 78166 TaxID=1644106 RepID=UPI00142F40BC|nr:iron-hydroxamate ABC transporter substrate-binding protein [Ammoniphilus sp. YIM 78166]